MVAEVFAGIGALKTAFDIAKGLKDIDDAARRNAAVIDLQEKILSAQAAQSSLIQTADDLEKEVARLKDWEADKSRYQLSELRPGLVALSLEESMKNGEPIIPSVQIALPMERNPICKSISADPTMMSFAVEDANRR